MLIVKRIIDDETKNRKDACCAWNSQDDTGFSSQDNHASCIADTLKLAGSSGQNVVDTHATDDIRNTLAKGHQKFLT